PEIGDQEDSMSAFEGIAQAARLEQIPFYDANTTPLERLCRLARRVAAGHAHLVLARRQQRVDDAAALRTGTTDDCNGLLGHVRVFSFGTAQRAAEVPSFLSSWI